MNKRIRELEKQCWDHQTNHLNSEKFAELIIKECLSIADENGAYTAMDAIIERFGVEL
jgi:hypothetical protein